MNAKQIALMLTVAGAAALPSNLAARGLEPDPASPPAANPAPAKPAAEPEDWNTRASTFESYVFSRESKWDVDKIRDGTGTRKPKGVGLDVRQGGVGFEYAQSGHSGLDWSCNFRVQTATVQQTLNGANVGAEAENDGRAYGAGLSAHYSRRLVGGARDGKWRVAGRVGAALDSYPAALKESSTGFKGSLTDFSVRPDVGIQVALRSDTLAWLLDMGAYMEVPLDFSAPLAREFKDKTPGNPAGTATWSLSPRDMFGVTLGLAVVFQSVRVGLQLTLVNETALRLGVAFTF